MTTVTFYFFLWPWSIYLAIKIFLNSFCHISSLQSDRLSPFRFMGEGLLATSIAASRSQNKTVQSVFKPFHVRREVGIGNSILCTELCTSIKNASSATLKHTYDRERASDGQPTTTWDSLAYSKPYWNAQNAESSTTARRNESHLQAEGDSFQMREM